MDIIIYAESKFTIIGHVDAGKSTLMGRLLFDLKIIPERTLDVYRREASALGKSSFALAWVMDSSAHERNYGVTIDVATRKFSTDTTDFTILDAPGHKDFIPSMIAGASAADFAVLVVDASTGEFESGLQGQTKEHALLVRSMGVSRLVIAVNKLDTMNWSQSRFVEIQQQLTAFLTIANFRAENLSFIPCSGLSGENIVNPATNSTLTVWYSGPSLVKSLESTKSVTRAIDAALRVNLSDIFTGIAQYPLSAAGRIASGSLQVGDQLLGLPSNEICTVKAIEIGHSEADAGGETVDWAVAGQDVILHLATSPSNKNNLVEIERNLQPGDIFCGPDSPVRLVTSFAVKILAFEHILPGPMHVHRGRMDVLCNVTQLIAVLDKASGESTGKKRPRMIKPGQVARIRMELDEEAQFGGRKGLGMPLEEGTRVVLRIEGRTAATGVVE